MADAPECSQELAFFGKVTASVSHELKNYLALINEYNGLLCDLVMAHEMGRALDLGRLKSLCGDIKRQVTAGGAVLDHLNGLAHSVDQEVQPVDLGRCLGLFVALSRRSAARQGVELELMPPPEGLSLRTQLFTLLRGLWQCLEAALAACPAGGRLILEAAVEGGQARVSLRGAPPAAQGQAVHAPAAALLTALGASFSRQDDGCLRLCLPLAGA
ncbi:MAG: HAMP domain-containing histidine kinase [Desulfarculus sp.]|nr:HAMP domain-containing histidine kinase [Desulfarculus sp.]